MIKTNVKVRGFINGISNKYNINFFLLLNWKPHTKEVQSDDFSLIAHYKLLT